jgi:hypothetical protein
VRAGREPPAPVSIGGPVEEIDGVLVLRIPLDAGGRDLVECSRGIGHVRGDFLNVVIPGWLAEKLGLFPGSHVIVDNAGGKFNIRSDDPAA